jgi:hypothetical protein
VFRDASLTRSLHHETNRDCANSDFHRRRHRYVVGERVRAPDVVESMAAAQRLRDVMAERVDSWTRELTAVKSALEGKGQA